MKDSYIFEKATICRLPGNVVVVLPYQHVIKQKNDLVYIGTDTDSGTIWGIMRNLEVIVEPIYNALGPCENGMIAFKQGNKWGYMNEKCEVVIPAKYVTACNFQYDIAKVAIFNGREFYIDKRGRKLKTDDDEDY
ncbi:MAG: WG repeat-containing protein [Clostridia bacterium]|nr:WG repeat-containing protein [Clostridia bacterium]